MLNNRLYFYLTNCCFRIRASMYWGLAIVFTDIVDVIENFYKLVSCITYLSFFWASLLPVGNIYGLNDTVDRNVYDVICLITNVYMSAGPGHECTANMAANKT